MRFTKGAHKREEYFGSTHRFEHWYRDNSIYFLTARCRAKYPAFRTEEAKSIFWDRFTHYAVEFGCIYSCRSVGFGLPGACVQLDRVGPQDVRAIALQLLAVSVGLQPLVEVL